MTQHDNDTLACFFSVPQKDKCGERELYAEIHRAFLIKGWDWVFTFHFNDHIRLKWLK